MKFKVVWNNDGWTTLQEADAAKHILEIMCFAKDGSVTDVRIRHNDGEEQKGNVTYNGKNALPMDIEEFKKLFKAGKLEIK